MKKKPNKKTIEALQEEDLNEWDSLEELIESIETTKPKSYDEYVERNSESAKANK